MERPPRIAFDELTPELQQLLSPRVERLGYLGEFFQCAAHQPYALAAFVAFTESLKEALPWRLAEVTALAVATATGNDYERVQHEHLALKLGMSEAEVRQVVAGRLDSGDFDDAERAAEQLARSVVDGHGRRSACPFDRLLELTDPSVAVGCLLMAGRYLAHGAIANAWGLRPPVASPLAEVGHD